MAERALSAEDWRGYGRDGFPEDGWQRDGATLVACASAPRIDLLSRERYGDFVFECEWWLPPAGNSGVLYRVSEQAPQAWQSGPELQLLDDAGHPDGREPRTSCGALYALIAPAPRLSPAAGRWHTARVVVRGTQVEHWLDGERVLGTDLADPQLRERIAQSKFRDFPDFARHPEGHIVLQHHGTDARFRSMRVARRGGRRVRVGG